MKISVSNFIKLYSIEHLVLTSRYQGKKLVFAIIKPCIVWNKHVDAEPNLWLLALLHNELSSTS